MRRIFVVPFTLVVLGGLVVGGASPATADAEVSAPIPVTFSAAARTLVPGDAIRFRDVQNQWRSARFVEASRSDLVLSTTGFHSETLVVPRSGARLQVLSSTQRHTGVGLLIGAVFGYCFGYYSEKARDDREGFIVIRVDPTASGLLGMAVFGMIGGVVGTMVRSTTWEDVKIDP